VQRILGASKPQQQRVNITQNATRVKFEVIFGISFPRRVHHVVARSWHPCALQRRRKEKGGHMLRPKRQPDKSTPTHPVTILYHIALACLPTQSRRERKGDITIKAHVLRRQPCRHHG
jgi:hypothetical protein